MIKLTKITLSSTHYITTKCSQKFKNCLLINVTAGWFSFKIIFLIFILFPQKGVTVCSGQKKLHFCFYKSFLFISLSLCLLSSCICSISYLKNVELNICLNIDVYLFRGERERRKTDLISSLELLCRTIKI